MTIQENKHWYRDDQGVPHGIVRAKSTLADVFSVAPQTVERWGFPREPDGSYDLEKIYHWRNRHKTPVDKEKSDRSDHLGRKAAAEAEIKELEAEKRRRELANMDSDLVNRDDVTRFLAKFFSVVRDLAQRIPEELSPSWPTEQRALIREGLEDRISAYLNALHSYCDRVEEIGEPE